MEEELPQLDLYIKGEEMTPPRPALLKSGKVNDEEIFQNEKWVGRSRAERAMKKAKIKSALGSPAITEVPLT